MQYMLVTRSEMPTWFPALVEAMPADAEWLLIESLEQQRIIGTYTNEEDGDRAFRAAYAAASDNTRDSK